LCYRPDKVSACRPPREHHSESCTLEEPQEDSLGSSRQARWLPGASQVEGKLIFKFFYWHINCTHLWSTKW
jgi:hypothetical protein